MGVIKRTVGMNNTGIYFNWYSLRVAFVQMLNGISDGISAKRCPVSARALEIQKIYTLSADRQNTQQ